MLRASPRGVRFRDGFVRHGVVSFAMECFRSLRAEVVAVRRCGDRAKGTWPSPLHSPALRRLPRRFAVPSLTHASDGPASIRSCSTPPFAASMRLILESFPRSASSDGAHTPAATAMTFWGFSFVVYFYALVLQTAVLAASTAPSAEGRPGRVAWMRRERGMSHGGRIRAVRQA
ncbi:hypothetical protein JOJ88_003901 [Pantoea cypripedii]|nr:hypothetical protein [Pantoea cypripedii]